MTDMNNNKEIDIIAVAINILKEWKVMARFVIVGAFVGIIVALNTPKMYDSQVELAPEFSSSSFGLSDNLTELASSFGINMGGANNVDAIYPDLYPDIFSSTDFIMSLYDVPIRTTDNNKTRPYLDHLLKETKVPFWRYPAIWLKALIAKPKASNGGNGESDSFFISRNDWELIEAIRSMISCSVDKKTQVITISVTDQDPLAAAIMTDTLQQRLQTYITDYKTAKTRIDVAHYTQLANKAKQRYQNIRHKYINSSDGNKQASLMSAIAKTEDYKNEMDQEYELYTQYLAQLKIAESKLQEKTPAFTVIQRAVTNLKPTSTPRIMILALWMFMAATAGAIWIQYGRHIRKILNIFKN